MRGSSAGIHRFTRAAKFAWSDESFITDGVRMDRSDAAQRGGEPGWTRTLNPLLKGPSKRD